jgi:hypothetical protein
MNTYNPILIPTDNVNLPAALEQLTELLAKNAHDMWALQRIHDGWEFGPTRNDVMKEHPDLIPYEQLSDGEKEYDRITTMETLKAILALGYKIVEPEKNDILSKVVFL